MPIVQCRSRLLFRMLGWTGMTQCDFDRLCWDYGLELDAVTSERSMFLQEMGLTEETLLEKDKETQEKVAAKCTEELYKVEVPANRYDLLCVEGLAQTLRTFGWQKPGESLKRSPRIEFKVKPRQQGPLRMVVKPSILPIRRYVVCAVLRDVTFDQDRYDSFISLQEKLHHNIARKRTLVSVGTHDLDKVSQDGPFVYEALPRSDIDFLPLAYGERGNLRGKEIEKYYEGDKHIGQYVPIIGHLDSFPVVRDSSGRIMSLPPIINSEFSKIELTTKNVFIEATATDHTKAMIAVNMICTAFSEYCKDQYTVEPVEVEYPEPDKWVADGKSKIELCPRFEPRCKTVEVDYINGLVGIKLSGAEVAEKLDRMNLDAAPVEDGAKVLVKIPPSRPDILSDCDVMEDVAISYGYDRILADAVAPKTISIGKQQPLEKITNLIRSELAYSGYTEILTFSLCAADEAFAYCRRPDNGIAVRIENPQTKEFQICRPSLLPGTLKTLSFSKSLPAPFRLFEVTDVVLKDGSHRLGCRNERRVVAVYAPHPSAGGSGFEEIHGLFEQMMQKLGVDKVGEAKSREGFNRPEYRIEEGSDDGCFYPGRQVDCFVNQKRVGSFGVLHPAVLKSFEIGLPCSYMEFSLEAVENAGAAAPAAEAAPAAVGHVDPQQ
eukprot:TRINITY_DN8054_c4_g1_i1.p2 TRINITY_DN8054_c4_g1~~TRINITY_DN8054_c4_g1_i1.p2  ORF type:complete len:662 (+),score=215.77 TRINITY_DN8054_c4_g1_i1:101-2086(+)